MFKSETGTFILHVPYRGGGPAVQDAIAGHVQLVFATALEASGHVKAGKLRALAVTGAQRVPALPEVPTLAESGLPASTRSPGSACWRPPARRRRSSSDRRRPARGAGGRGREAAPDRAGRGAGANTPAQFAQLIETDRQRYARIIRERGITVD
jgi:tripartite-type tricarboxylate transporter receptor subunit TctC